MRFLFNLMLFFFIVQVSIVGDFSEEEIESCILDYLGTVSASRDSEREHEFSPILFRPSPSDLQFQQVSIAEIMVTCISICWNQISVIHLCIYPLQPVWLLPRSSEHLFILQLNVFIFSQTGILEGHR